MLCVVGGDEVAVVPLVQLSVRCIVLSGCINYCEPVSFVPLVVLTQN